MNASKFFKFKVTIIIHKFQILNFEATQVVLTFCNFNYIVSAYKVLNCKTSKIDMVSNYI